MHRKLALTAALVAFTTLAASAAAQVHIGGPVGGSASGARSASARADELDDSRLAARRPRHDAGVPGLPHH